jgi:UDP-glucuronate 4-epimerase
MNMKNILITGGAGFIGFHLVKRLLNDGANVISIDNINDYYDTDLKSSRLKELDKIRGGEYRFYQIDLNDKEEINNIFKSNNIDCVVNLAAQAGVRYAKKNPDIYIDSNIRGFYNLIKQSQANNVGKFIYASSSSVYGSNNKLPFSEGDAVNTPMSIYAATKKSNFFDPLDCPSLVYIMSKCHIILTDSGAYKKRSLAWVSRCQL